MSVGDVDGGSRSGDGRENDQPSKMRFAGIHAQRNCEQGGTENLKHDIRRRETQRRERQHQHQETRWVEPGPEFERHWKVVAHRIVEEGREAIAVGQQRPMPFEDRPDRAVEHHPVGAGCDVIESEEIRLQRSRSDNNPAVNAQKNCGEQ